MIELEFPAIAKWLKEAKGRKLEITWGDMTGHWFGYEETLTGFMASLYENESPAGSSAPQETTEESLQIVDCMLAVSAKRENPCNGE